MLQELQKKETATFEVAIKKYVIYLSNVMDYLSGLESRLVIKKYIIDLVDKAIENHFKEPIKICSICGKKINPCKVGENYNWFIVKNKIYCKECNFKKATRQL